MNYWKPFRRKNLVSNIWSHYIGKTGWYSGVQKLYSHFSVDHGKGQYVDGDAYTNTIEGFWTLLKRGYIGIYHSMSRKHLQKYVDEFVFRYNTRKISDSERFKFLLSKTNAYMMTYNDLIAA